MQLDCSWEPSFEPERPCNLSGEPFARTSPSGPFLQHPAMASAVRLPGMGSEISLAPLVQDGGVGITGGPSATQWPQTHRHILLEMPATHPQCPLQSPSQSARDLSPS